MGMCPTGYRCNCQHPAVDCCSDGWQRSDWYLVLAPSLRHGCRGLVILHDSVTQRTKKMNKHRSDTNRRHTSSTTTPDTWGTRILQQVTSLVFHSKPSPPSSSIGEILLVFPIADGEKKQLGIAGAERENERAVLMNEQSALLPNESRLRNACASFYGGSITLAAAYLERIFWLSRCRTCRRSLLLASLLFYKTITKCETQL